VIIKDVIQGPIPEDGDPTVNHRPLVPEDRGHAAFGVHLELGQPRGVEKLVLRVDQERDSEGRWQFVLAASTGDRVVIGHAGWKHYSVYAPAEAS